MRTIWISALLLSAAACGGGDDDGAQPDATANTDVVSVSCAGATIAATVMTGVGTYDPVDTTISVGEIVEFDLGTGHDVTSSDGFHVNFAGNGCFRFDAAGTYPFHCSAHGFMGSIIVQ